MLRSFHYLFFSPVFFISYFLILLCPWYIVRQGLIASHVMIIHHLLVPYTWLHKLQLRFKRVEHIRAGELPEIGELPVIGNCDQHCKRLLKVLHRRKSTGSPWLRQKWPCVLLILLSVILIFQMPFIFATSVIPIIFSRPFQRGPVLYILISTSKLLFDRWGSSGAKWLQTEDCCLKNFFSTTIYDLHALAIIFLLELIAPCRQTSQCH